MAVITRTKTKTKNPSLYRVLILNDDYTPMEFVVHVLERFFRRTAKPPHASCFMFTIIEWASAGSYNSRVAETKVSQVMDFARQNQHPLQCVMEKK